MKYPEEMYIDSQIFAGDMDGSESNLTEKVVKIRNSHLCCVCEKQIPKGERMLNQKAIVEGQGWCSCYICLPCVENWLEESGQVEDGENELEKFFSRQSGKIMANGLRGIIRKDMTF